MTSEISATENSKPPPDQRSKSSIDLLVLIRKLEDLQSRVDGAKPSHPSALSGQGDGADAEARAEAEKNLGKSSGEGSSKQEISGSPPEKEDEADDRARELNKLNNNLDQIVSGLSKLLSFEKYLSGKITISTEDVEKVLVHVKSADAKKSVEIRLKQLNKDIMKLKHQIPSSLAVEKSKKSGGGPGESENPPEVELVDDLLTMELSDTFCKSELYDEIKAAYDGLESKEKECLLCFSVFCENEELKRRMLTYWWAGEGLISADGITIREAAEKMIKTFVSKGLIVPVHKKKLPEAKRFLMTPVVRSAIVKIAKDEDLFSYNKHGSFMAKFKGGNKEAEERSKEVATRKAKEEEKKAADEKETAMKDGSTTSRLNWFRLKGEESESRVKEESSGHVDSVRLNWLKYWSGEEKLLTIFNVSTKFPDLELKTLAKYKDLEAKEWLSKMTKLRVLYLGSWRASVKHHIEVDNTAFMEGLINMHDLKLLSLQGISRISELTGSIKGLTNLEILDLKSCHNLEVLPKEIGYLRNLTHLDISNCFLIDHMPRALSWLTKLQVLKGFVVGDYGAQKFCTLQHLSRMRGLIKLTVIVSKKNFPNDTDLKALHALEALKKLTLSWGANSAIEEKKGKSSSNEDLKLPANLEKLDIQSYPSKTRPAWLSPSKLANLQKLYIRGGILGDDPGLLIKEEIWSSVKTLRLKYLTEIKMNWEEIQRWFPELTYLEKVDCPLITLCPCDDEGVWTIDATMNQ